MKLLVFVLVVLKLIGNDISAQNAKFDPLKFLSASVNEWATQIQSKRFTCLQQCRTLIANLKSEPPTLPPFYFNVNAQLKTTVNCSGEVRRLQPLCSGWFRYLDIVQVGGMQYYFPLEKQLKYSAAQKHCRSLGLELAMLRNQIHEGFVIASYLKYYTNLKNLTNLSRFNFWDGRSERRTDRASALVCPSFSLNMSDVRGMVAARANESCSVENSYFCEVPTLCYKDICRGGFISKFRVMNSSTNIATTKGPATTVASPVWICEQCHLNHQVMFTLACPELTCPTCSKSVNFDRSRARECNGKYYFYHDYKFNFNSAATGCCELGMQPVNIMSDDDVECIKDYLLEKGMRPSDLDSGRWMWTSATDLGTGCQDRFSWCGTRTAVNGLSRMPFDPINQTESGDCLALFVKATSANEFTVQLGTKGCFQNFAVLCEAIAPRDVPRTSALSRNSPCKSTANTCPKPFEILERTIHTNEVGRRSGGVRSYMICDVYYEAYLGTSTFDNAPKICGDKRLDIATVDSYEELNCIRDLYFFNRFNGEVKDMENTPERTLLKASDRACEGQFLSWCNNRNSISPHLFKPNLGTNRCLGIDLKLSRFSLQSVPCDQQYPILCKENTTCRNPTCPEINCVTSIPMKQESVKKICGSNYLIIEEPKSMTEALETCCQMGMGLLSIESPEEQTCLNKFMRSSMSSISKVWTSATDAGCKSRYAWCSTGEMLAYESFNSFQIVQQTGDNFDVESCASANFADGTQLTLLMREQCSRRLAFICETTRRKIPANVVSGPVSPSLNRIFNTTML